MADIGRSVGGVVSEQRDRAWESGQERGGRGPSKDGGSVEVAEATAQAAEAPVQAPFGGIDRMPGLGVMNLAAFRVDRPGYGRAPEADKAYAEQEGGFRARLAAHRARRLAQEAASEPALEGPVPGFR